MNSKKEQVWVGSFVLIAAALLVVVVMAASGSFSERGATYQVSVKYAAGLGMAAPVRYGGITAGKVERIHVDPLDSSRIEIVFRVEPGIPVKTDTIAKITAIGALGENYLELTTGTKDSPLAPPGSRLQSQETLAISDLADMVSGMAPVAKDVLQNLNARLGEMKTTIAQVNDLLGDKNRQNISGSLATLNAMLMDSRPKVEAVLSNIHAASEKFPALSKNVLAASEPLPQVSKNVLAASERITPLLDDLKGTIKEANEALAKVDAVLGENRPDIRATMIEIHKTMDTASKTADLLRSILDRNSDNLDESLANVRVATDNLRELTDTVKRKPTVLIRGETGKDRQPGGAQ